MFSTVRTGSPRLCLPWAWPRLLSALSPKCCHMFLCTGASTGIFRPGMLGMLKPPPTPAYQPEAVHTLSEHSKSHPQGVCSCLL
eukprot:6294711-Pyramimonas_sp.AAC.1